MSGMLAYTNRRKSRRLSGEETEALPPPSSAGSKSSLRTLLATEWRNGRPVEDDGDSGWQLAGSSSTSVASSVTGPPSAFSSCPLPPEAVKAFQKMLFTADCPSDSEDDDEELDPLSMHYKAVDEASNKLIIFDQLKKMIESSCACKYCQSPVSLKQETYGVATNLYLTCIPSDKRRSVHQYSFVSDRMTTPAAAAAPPVETDGL